MNIIIKVSIVIPVYNVEKYIDKCLESVLNQTYDNFEVIVGMYDATLSMALEKDSFWKSSMDWIFLGNLWLNLL